MNKTAEKTPAPPHDLILEGRSKLTVTGVKRVLRCDADSAAMETGQGVLHLTGAELNVTSLDLESGEVRLTGRIDALEYTAERTPGGLLRRLLGRLLLRLLGGTLLSRLRGFLLLIRCRSLCNPVPQRQPSASRPQRPL